MTNSENHKNRKYNFLSNAHGTFTSVNQMSVYNRLITMSNEIP